MPNIAEPTSRKSLLVVVTSDPKSSHRPAEAIRLAAGVAAWRKVDISIYFAGPAVVAVSPDPDDFVDEESYTRYLPMLQEFGCPILVEGGRPAAGPTSVPYATISPKELATRAAQMTYLLRF